MEHTAVQDNSAAEFAAIAWWSVAASLLVATFIILFLIKYRQRQKFFLQEKEQLRLKSEKELLNAQLEISEQLFKDISQEIHDNVGQTLSLAKLHLGSIDNDEKIEMVKDLITRAIGNLRDLSKSLHGNYVLDLGLVHAIDREVQMLGKSGKISAHFNQDIAGTFQFSSNQEIILFRCVQESLNNVVKHSRAERVDVSLQNQNGHIILQISDNGKGMTGNENSGIGMRSMKDRVKTIGGELKVESGISGTSLLFRIPATTG